MSRTEPEIHQTQSFAYQQGGSKASIPDRGGPSAVSPSQAPLSPGALGGELTTRGGFFSSRTAVPSRGELPSILHLGSGS